MPGELAGDREGEYDVACVETIDEARDLCRLAPLVKAGHPEAVAAFCEAAYPLVWSVVLRDNWYLPTGSGGSQEDLVQEGIVRLLQSLRTWDPVRWPVFMTFAVMVIRREMKEQVIRSPGAAQGQYRRRQSE
jgi:RNA polymerase sigma factor (sigma-70 family)